jgi:hypothetical protein
MNATSAWISASLRFRFGIAYGDPHMDRSLLQTSSGTGILQYSFRARKWHQDKVKVGV